MSTLLAAVETSAMSTWITDRKGRDARAVSPACGLALLLSVISGALLLAAKATTWQ
jgi:hypothetical protein